MTPAVALKVMKLRTPRTHVGELPDEVGNAIHRRRALGLCHLDVPRRGLAITVGCLGTGPMCSRQTVQEATRGAAPERQGM